MKINKFLVSAIFYFKSGTSKKVDWIEDRLVKKVTTDERDVQEGLTLDEADTFFQGKFKEWKDNGSTIVRKNAKGGSSIIPFSEVEYATLSVYSVDDGELEEPEEPSVGSYGTEVVKTTGKPFGKQFDYPKPPNSRPRDIKDHPANIKDH